MGSREDMVAAMEKILGLGETPPGSNRNYVSSWYGLVGPWCDMTVTYAAYHSGNEQAVCFGGKFAYTVAHAQAFKNHGQWHTDVAGIGRGDIVFFDWDGSNSIAAIDHVGIVTGTSGSMVLTIEGNSANVCARRVRYAADIVGYGRPAYTATPRPPSPTPTPAAQYQPFPGAGFFHDGQNSPVITRMGKRLVANGCGRYAVGPGPMWSQHDKDSYAAWQRKCGFSGTDANGTPGQVTWDRLKVSKS